MRLFQFLKSRNPAGPGSRHQDVEGPQLRSAGVALPRFEGPQVRKAGPALPGCALRRNLKSRLAQTPALWGLRSPAGTCGSGRSPSSVHSQKQRILQKVEPPTRPRPIPWQTHQAALHRIAMHVVQLFQPLLLAVNVDRRLAQTPVLWGLRSPAGTCGSGRSPSSVHSQKRRIL